MKKLIAILVVFALVMGAAFAEASISGAVFGAAILLQGDTKTDSNGDGTDAQAGIDMKRMRLEASGQDDDGVFGAWVRLDGGSAISAAYAWWKPIDQFLMRIGSNGGDGFWAKEGVFGWGFYGMPCDAGVVSNNNVWGGGYLSEFKYRDVFFGGIGGDALFFEIKPAEMIGINLAVGNGNDGDVEKFYGNVYVQLDLNLDFGNIAVTFDSGRGYVEAEKNKGATLPDGFRENPADSGIYVPKTRAVSYDGTIAEPAKVFVYAGIPIGDNMSLDVGLSYEFPITVETAGADITTNAPIGIGAGLKVSISEQFGLKFRAAAKVAGSTVYDPAVGDSMTINDPTFILADVLPYYAINDKVTVFCSIGLAIALMPTDDDSKDAAKVGMYPYPKYVDDWTKTGDLKLKDSIGWHINPYITVGSEWGPKFLAGVRIYSYGDGDGGYGKKGDEKAPIYFEVPIAIQASF